MTVQQRRHANAMQSDFNAAAALADQSRLARLGYRLWETNGIPKALRVWGMRRWNARYRDALGHLLEVDR